MSTKIYNAFAWKGSGGIEGLLKKLTALRDREFKRAITMATSHATLEKFNWIEYMDDLRAAMKTGLHYTDKGNYNPSSSATVHFHRGKIYVIFFSLSRATPVPPFGGLHDFHYQNQTDRDDGITDKQWKDRERTWDAIFKKDSRPGHAGFVFEIIDDSDCLSLAYAVFERLHGHRAGDESAVKKCETCMKKRKAWIKSEIARRSK